MEGERLEQELRDYFMAEVQKVEPSREWWNNIVIGLRERKRRSFWSGFIPKTRLAWALLPLILLLVGGTAYGATFIVRELFWNYAGHLEEAGLAQELDLSQTVEGVTVRLERAYADANVVLVGLTVSGPGERYFTRGGNISTVDGQSLPRMGCMGFVPGSDIIMGGWRPSERTAMLVEFDASLIEREPSTLNLRLVTRIEDSPLPGDIQSSFGPFVFDFDVPFHAAKVVSVGQTVEAAGVPITLERVRITPWATRAVFRFHPPYVDEDPTPIVSLKLPRGDSKRGSFGRGVPDESSAEYHQHYFIGDYTSLPGEWTMIISELVLTPDLSGWTEVEIEGQEGDGPKVLIRTGNGKGNDENRLAGPWVFHFEVP